MCEDLLRLDLLVDDSLPCEDLGRDALVCEDGLHEAFNFNLSSLLEGGLDESILTNNKG